MASSHQGQSKRAAVSLEEWEAKAPLNDLELASINALKVANSVIPLPLSVCFLAVQYPFRLIPWLVQCSG